MDIILGIPRVSLRTQSRRSQPFSIVSGVLMVECPGRSDGAVRVSKLEASDLLVGSWVTGSISTSPSVQILIGQVNHTYIGHTEIMICMAPQALQLSGNRTMESRRRSRQQGIILR